MGPAGRVLIGLLAGVALLVASQWLLGRGYRYFSEGIAALGGGVLFLSVYAAWGFYELVPQGVAFAGLVLVTVTLAGLATARSSQRLAVLALAAGLWAPGLLSTGVDRQVTLFSYLAVLLACFLALAWRQGWRWIAPLALFGALIYFIGWYERFYEPAKLGRTWLFASVLFGVLAAYLTLRGWRGRPLHPLELLQVPANALWYGVTLHAMLYDDHRWWLTIAVLVLAALYLGASRLIPAGERREPRPDRLVHAGLALAFATAAVPIRLEGEWITIIWAVEGALLVWAGLRSQVQALRVAGLALFVGVIGLLHGQAGAIERLVLNERFASFAVTVAALAMSARWARARKLELSECRVFAVAAAAANLIAVWALSEEIWYFLGRQRTGLDPRLAQQMGLSLLWAVAASLMILLGVRLGRKALRWQGLALLGLAVAKVFLYDLSFLERAYRIASFLVLGIVLLLVSFWYQRTLAGTSDEDRREASEEGDVSR